MVKILLSIAAALLAASLCFAAVELDQDDDGKIDVGYMPPFAANLNATETNLLWDTGVNYTDHVRTAPEVDGSAGATLTAAQVSGTIITNYGQAASDVANLLPTAAAGYNFLAVVYTAQSNKWGVRAGTNDKIYLIAADGTVTAGSDNGYARMTAAQAGQSFACWTFKTGASAWDWMCKAGSIGTSTFAAN